MDKLTDYPLYRFSCGCDLSFSAAQAHITRGKAAFCPDHPMSVLMAKLYICEDCGVLIIASRRGPTGMARYCQSCRRVRNNIGALGRYYRKGFELPQPPTITKVEPPPPVKPGPGHPCLRCDIHNAGESKLGRTCHYCNFRIEWADAQDERWG